MALMAEPNAAGYVAGGPLLAPNDPVRPVHEGGFQGTTDVRLVAMKYGSSAYADVGDAALPTFRISDYTISWTYSGAQTQYHTNVKALLFYGVR
jgi:hypothetical protein